MRQTQRWADQRIIELGISFDELTAAMDRVPEGDDIPEALDDHLTDVFSEIEELVATTQEALKVKAHVHRYYQQLGHPERELSMSRSLLRDLGWVYSPLC